MFQMDCLRAFYLTLPNPVALRLSARMSTIEGLFIKRIPVLYTAGRLCTYSSATGW